MAILYPHLKLAFGILGALALSSQLSAALNPIQQENTLAGTTSWQLTKPSQNGEIQGYAGSDSLNLDEVLKVYVSTTSPTFDIECYRLGYYAGKGGNLKFAVRNLKGENQGCWIYPNAAPSGSKATTNYSVAGQQTNLVDCHWDQCMSFKIPVGWVSGIYLLKLTENKTGTQWHVPFVVRHDQGTCQLLFKRPSNTDQAYNLWGGDSFYCNYKDTVSHYNDRATYVSFNRPYWLGFGTQYLLTTEYPMARFMEERGYNMLYTTNSAIASGKTKLTGVKGLVTAGHDEYVSQAERYAIEKSIKAGLSVGYFGANNVYWQVRTQPDFYGSNDRFLVCYKEAMNHNTNTAVYIDPVRTSGPMGLPLVTTQWRAAPINYAETHLENEDWCAECVVGGEYDFVVQNPASWVYNNTALKAGDHIPNIIAGEIDKVDTRFLKSPAVATVIGQSLAYGNNSGTRLFPSSAVLTEYPAGNFVFDAGTFFWSIALSNFPSYVYAAPAFQPELGGWPFVAQNIDLQQMTANILNRMISHPVKG